MAFDYKKEYKDLYMPGKSPTIVEVPPMSFVAVRGAGDPNEEGGAYSQALGLLYAVSYTLKMSRRGARQIEGYFDYVVPPLEGFWWQEHDGRTLHGFDRTRKEEFRWISCIRLPEFVGKDDLAWAVETAAAKKGLDCSAAEFLTFDEGLCVQCLHVGPYDGEPATVAAMDACAAAAGYGSDLSEVRPHHEIYLSDPRRTDPAKWRTIVRHPIA